MKVLHINTYDKNGGAAIAALRLHNAMLLANIDSKYLVLEKTLHDRIDILTISRYSRYIKKIINNVLERNITKNMNAIKGLFSSFKYGFKIVNRQEIIKADIIYLHWINSFLNYNELKKLIKTGKPIFWFMHDMFPITGGCHHSFNCTNYVKKCHKCPYNKKGIDHSVRQYKAKKKLYKQYNNLYFVTPSRWLFSCVKNCDITKNNKIYHIPNLIDMSLFKPIKKNVARELFSINRNVMIIGFGADYALNNKYKGWEYMENALLILKENGVIKNIGIELIIFGSNYNKEVDDKIPYPIHFLGHLNDDYSMIMAYNCMDIFVIPSIAENFPNTVLESLSCNIPVVGFIIGGIPDMVNDNTGYLSEYKNSNDLAKGIALLIKEKKFNVREYVKSLNQTEIVNKHKDIWIINNIHH